MRDLKYYDEPLRGIIALLAFSEYGGGYYMVVWGTTLVVT